MSDYLTIAEAAARANVTATAVHKWIKAGHLTAYGRGASRTFYVKRDELEAFLAPKPIEAMQADAS